jgi:hypothetical protein
MNLARLAAATAIVLLMVSSPVLGGDKGTGKEQKRPVFAQDFSALPDGPITFGVIHGDWTRLTRFSDRVRIETALSDLNPNWVYNVHIWIFNNPAACQGNPTFINFGGRCYAFPDQFSPAAGPSVVSFGGFIPDSSGRLDLELDLKISEGLPAVSLFETGDSFTSAVLPSGGISVGLIDPMHAEIQFVLVRKGPIQPDATVEQFQTVFGACGPDFTLPPFDPNQICVNVRFSMVGGTL